MQKLLIQLSEGKNILEKIEIGSSRDLNKLFDTLRTKMIMENANGSDKKIPNQQSEDSKAIVKGLGTIYMREPDSKFFSHNITLPSAGNNDIIDTEEDKYSETRSIEGGATIYTMKEFEHKTGICDCNINEGNVLIQSNSKSEGIEAIKAEINSIDLQSTSEIPKEGFEGFFIMKCPRCGKMKCFKSNTNTLFHCECGSIYSTAKYAKIYGKCPNCSNNVGTLDYVGLPVMTLEGMDISEGMRCNKCKSPVDFTYNKARGIWVSLTE